MAHRFLSTSLLFFSTLMATNGYSFEASSPPNVVVIQVSQPLAQKFVAHVGSRGATLTHYATSPALSADRAALMTGRDPIRLGIAYNNIRPWDNAGIHSDETTLATRLQQAGYQTAFLGNWGLGHSQAVYHPMEKGFEYFSGQLLVEAEPTPPYRAEGGIDLQKNSKTLQFDDHINQLVLKESTRFLTNPKSEHPFFLLLSFTNNSPIGEKTTQKAIEKVLARIAESEKNRNTLVIVSNRAHNDTLMSQDFLSPQNSLTSAAFIWAEKIPPETKIHTLTSSIDILPTVIAATGATYKHTKKIDGINLLPQLMAKADQSLDLPKRQITLIHEAPRYGSVKALQLNSKSNSKMPFDSEISAYSLNSYYSYTQLSLESLFCPSMNSECTKNDSTELALTSKNEIRQRRALHPINGIRHTEQAPPGWRAPQQWLEYTIPMEKLSETPALGDVPGIARVPLDYQLGDKGRIVYDCEPVWWQFNLCF